MSASRAPDLQPLIDEPTEASRAVLFAHLAHSVAGVRARAAEGLLKLYATRRYRGGLARDFGSEAEAILTRAMDELRALIGEPKTPAWTRFTNSLVMDMDAWRDGAGYDLASLHEMSEIERGAIREMIKTRLRQANRSPDWRDLEAAKALEAHEVLEELTEDSDAQVRLRAKSLVGSADDVAAEVSRTLRSSRDEDAVSRALDHVANHPTDDVKKALLARVRKVDAHFINAAMVLLEVFSGVEDAWAERPFLFEVQAQGSKGPLMKQLLARVGSSKQS